VAEQWNLGTGGVQLVEDGINFTNIEEVGRATGSAVSSSIAGTSADELYLLSSTPGELSVADMNFDSIEIVDGGAGSDTVQSPDNTVWSLEDSSWLIGTGKAIATVDAVVNSIAVYFENIEQVTNTGDFNGPVTNTIFELTGVDSFELQNISFNDVSNITGGAGDNTLIGPNSSSTWTVNGNSGVVNGLTFANMSTLQGGSAEDVMTIASGTAGNIYTGAGNDTVTFTGGDVSGLYLEAGNDIVHLNNAASDASILDGGLGSDTLNNNISDLTWTLNNTSSGVNSVGDFDFTGFENLNNAGNRLLVRTSLASTFSGNSVALGGMNLGFAPSSYINFVSGSTVNGNIQADELLLTAGGDVTLETNINLLELQSTGSINATISENDDLVIREINIGSGDLQLTSKNLGVLSAETRGNTHITARAVTLGTIAERWRAIGDQFNPLRMDVTDSVDITAINFVTPEFVGTTPTVTSTGTEIDSLVTSGAAEGLNSVVQDQVGQFTQIDPAIFDSVNPYSVDVDAVNLPEFRLVAGELIPTAATATGEEQQEEEGAPADETVQ
jgi:hypothetical protein